MISVPDILPADVIEACGMQAHAEEKTQVYRVLPSDRCLSGTSEMAMGGYFSGQTLKATDLPKKSMAVSRCFRAEAGGSGKEEKNLYRVHYFTKVEMFAVCLPTQSEEMLEYFRDIEFRLFKSLGLCFKVYDMPIHELGAPAYRKYDIEAWMPSRQRFGEISSTSNCTDYQSKRLNIYVEDGDGNKMHAHTVNGTACAIPRTLIALLERDQVSGVVSIEENSKIISLLLSISDNKFRSHTRGASTLFAEERISQNQQSAATEIDQTHQRIIGHRVQSLSAVIELL